MRRILLPALAILLLTFGLGAGFLLRRQPGGPSTQELEHPLFLVQPQGRGEDLIFQPSEVPIRSLRWSRPLPGRAVVAQVLTQSNRQQAVLFVDGRVKATLTLERPADVPASVFNFAELEDAAHLPERLLLLLYRPSPSTEVPLLVAWNLQTATVQWVYRGPGDRLAPSPDGHCVFLFGPEAPVQILPLTGQNGLLLARPDPIRVELPPNAPGFTDLLATGPDRFLAVDATGLYAWQAGVWTQIPAPTKSPLGFSAYGARLAATGDTLWWQPEPGQLIQVDVDGQRTTPVALSALVSGPQAQDGPLLRLLGADPRGGLWFTPAIPDFTPPPPPGPDVPAIPQPEPPPAPIASSTPSLRETWTPYLKAGLGRIYRWQPGDPAMATFAWSRVWNQLGPPQAIPCPESDGGLAPEAEGCLMGGQEHRWWLPLTALPADQPR